MSILRRPKITGVHNEAIDVEEGEKERRDEEERRKKKMHSKQNANDDNDDDDDEGILLAPLSPLI